MSNKIDVTDFKIDDDLLYKSMKIKTHEKEALTPVKAVDLSKIKPKFEINRDENGLNEIHRIVYEKDQKYKSPEKKDVVRLPSIKSMNDDIDLQEKFQISLSNIKKKAREKDITMCFLEYQGDRYPNTDEIEFMVDISHQYSDLIPFPIISKTKEIENSSDFSSYLLFLNEYYEWLNKMNKKPMIAIVPKIGRSYLDELFDFYHGKDINAFYFDFEGRQPITIPPNIRKFFRKLTDENVFEKSFLHSTNIFPGRFRVSDTAINSKDILSFGLGFDCIGRNKKRPNESEGNERRK